MNWIHDIETEYASLIVVASTRRHSAPQQTKALSRDEYQGHVDNFVRGWGAELAAIVQEGVPFLSVLVYI